MEASKNLRDLLDLLVEKCGQFAEMPHHIDDTLIEKLLEHIEFDASCIQFLEKQMRKGDVETAPPLIIQLTIGFLSVSIKKGTWNDDVLLLEFVRKCMVIYQQDRPATVYVSFFQLLQLDRVFSLQRSDAWLPTFQYALSCIDDDRTSVFLQREMQQFICKLTPSDARRLRIIPGVLDILKRKMAPSPSPPSLPVIDVLTRIIDRYSDELAREEIELYMTTVRMGKRTGEFTLKTIIKLIDRHPDVLKVPMYIGSWENESNRIDLICMILGDTTRDPTSRIDATGDPSLSTIPGIVDIVMYSPAATMWHENILLKHMTPRQMSELCSQTRHYVSRPNRKWGLVAAFLTTLIEVAPASEVAPIYESIGVRVLESPALLKVITSPTAYGVDVFDRMPEFKNFGAQLKTWISEILEGSGSAEEWEKVDTALMIVSLLPTFLPSQEVLMALTRSPGQWPYVMVSVMKLLCAHYAGIPLDLLDHCITESADPPPKLFCLKHLAEGRDVDGIETSEMVKFISSALNDEGVEIRQEGLKLAGRMLDRPRSRDAEDVREVLRQFKTDSKIGHKVRKMLGEQNVEAEEEESEAVRILREMLTSLAVDETRDCY